MQKEHDVFVDIKKKVYASIESGNVEEALRLLDAFANTTNHDQLYQAAELYYELGHVDKARPLIEQLLELYPDEGELYVLAAEMMIDADQEDEAIEYLLEIGEHDPSFLQAQLLLADLYQLQSLDEVAEQRLLAAHKKASNEVIITYALGEFYLEQGSYNKAIPYLKQALHAKEELGDINVGLALAEAYGANGQFEDALLLYHQQKQNELPPNALFNFGFTAFQQGDYTVAIEQLEAVKTLDPDFTSVYVPLARAYEAEKRYEEAFETLAAGMRMDEFNDALPLLAGKLLYKQQDFVGAEQYLRQAIALNPTNTEALQTLAAFLREQERYDDLLELVEHAKSYGETDALLVWYEALAHKQLEYYETAREKYKEAYVAFHEDTDFLSEYGHFLLEEGERNKAVELFQKALQQSPERSDLSELLDELQAE
ncbi:hypothetical protein BC8716_18730 [Shouchella clausii]|nr:tetratricopeptide repeat protein [Shouchella clausii]AST97874.1 hypothetical protein BC8716_18730 [Shouchella clausii]QNM44317.1 tetratricopeptide repeat protein [Shouchella clausii]